jgi:hypothetical protein
VSSSRYTMAKCAWRLSTHKPLPSTPEELVRATRTIARTFFLSPEEHLQCAKLALQFDSDTLVDRIYADAVRESKR